MPETERPPAPTGRRRIALCALLVIALGAAWLGRGYLPGFAGPASKAPVQPVAQNDGVPVTLATARKGDFEMYLDALGTVQALNTVTVRAQVTGRITKIGFTQGSMVNAGDLLAQIDPQPYQAALDQAKGALARDQALLRGAEVDLARYKGLAAQKAVPQQTLDTQMALVAQDKGIVESDLASVEAANVNLQFCRIVSPLRGRAGFRLVDEGNLVQPSDTTGIVAITQVQPISVVFPAPQDDIPVILKALGAGAAPVMAMAEDGHTVLSRGTLSYTDNQVNVPTGTISLKATFANEDNALWPGQSVTVRLRLSTLKDVVLISENAVQHGPDGLFVYVASADGKAQMRPIKVAQMGNGDAVVSEGIQPGDRTVVDGAYRVLPGVRIRAAGDARPPGQAPPPGEGNAQVSSVGPSSDPVSNTATRK